ncbi:hypothetical protein NMG60_11031772 [Bertholletia excelsa]
MERCRYHHPENMAVCGRAHHGHHKPHNGGRLHGHGWALHRVHLHFPDHGGRGWGHHRHGKHHHGYHKRHHHACHGSGKKHHGHGKHGGHCHLVFITEDTTTQANTTEEQVQPDALAITTSEFLQIQLYD